MFEGNTNIQNKNRKKSQEKNIAINWVNDYSEDSLDDFEISLEDFEELKQDLQSRFDKLETLQEINIKIQQQHTAKRVKLSKECSYYKKLSEQYKNKHKLVSNDLKLPSSFSNLPDFFEQFMSTITTFSESKNRITEKLAETLVDLIWKDDFLDGFFVECLIRRSKSWLRQNVFSPERILEAMDNNGGHLSMTAIEILRILETNGEKNCIDTILPSSTTIKKVCKEVDKYCEKILPFEIGTLEESGEYARFKANQSEDGLVKQSLQCYDVITLL